MNRLDAIRQRIERATKGPWTKDISPEAWTGSDPKSIFTPEGIVAEITWQEHERHEADADFIARSRTDLPDLLAVVGTIVQVVRKKIDSSDMVDEIEAALSPLLQEVEG